MGSLPEDGRSAATTPNKAPQFVRSAYPAFFIAVFQGMLEERANATRSRSHQGKIVPRLVGFALPVLPALFLQTMYGAVGLMVVGRFGGEPANVYVSAVSTGSQIMQTVTVAITGLAMGLTVYVARSIGAFGVRLPVSWLMSRQVPVSLFPIGLATPASSMIQIILCIGWYLVTLRKYGRIPDKF